VQAAFLKLCRIILRLVADEQDPELAETEALGESIPEEGPAMLPIGKNFATNRRQKGR
jgi:hypothetical protein